MYTDWPVQANQVWECHCPTEYVCMGQNAKLRGHAPCRAPQAIRSPNLFRTDLFILTWGWVFNIAGVLGGRPLCASPEETSLRAVPARSRVVLDVPPRNTNRFHRKWSNIIKDYISINGYRDYQWVSMIIMIQSGNPSTSNEKNVWNLRHSDQQGELRPKRSLHHVASQAPGSSDRGFLETQLQMKAHSCWCDFDFGKSWSQIPTY